MSELLILVGLSASGKSTFAKEIADEFDDVIVSSDEIREEISFYEDQSRNKEVFEIFHKRIDEALANGLNVIADATNLTIKDRKPIIEIGKKHNAFITCAIMCTKFEDCCLRDDKREHSVGLNVLNKQIRKFQVPFFNEGFDDIIFDEDLEYSEELRNRISKRMNNFYQCNPHHQYTLGVHCRKSSEKILELIKEDNKDDDFCMATVKCFYNNSQHKKDILSEAMLFHDIGKLYTQTFDENGNAHYYNHANVGAYIYLTELFNITIVFNGVSEYDILQQAFIINYHMLPFEWKTEKANQKALKRFGKINYNLLKLAHEADKESC